MVGVCPEVLKTARPVSGPAPAFDAGVEVLVLVPTVGGAVDAPRLDSWCCKGVAVGVLTLSTDCKKMSIK